MPKLTDKQKKRLMDFAGEPGQTPMDVSNRESYRKGEVPATPWVPSKHKMSPDEMDRLQFIADYRAAYKKKLEQNPKYPYTEAQFAADAEEARGWKPRPPTPVEEREPDQVTPSVDFPEEGQKYFKEVYKDYTKPGRTPEAALELSEAGGEDDDFQQVLMRALRKIEEEEVS